MCVIMGHTARDIPMSKLETAFAASVGHSLVDDLSARVLSSYGASGL